VTPPSDPRLERREAARRRQARRRRVGLAALAAAAIGVGLWVGSRSDDSDSTPTEAAVTPAPADCPSRIADDPRRLAGQMLVVRFDGAATPELILAARRGEIGGVIAFPPLGLPPVTVRHEIARLQRAAREGGNPPLVVATDQEGGDVKRFPTAPPERGPATLTSTRAALAQGRATGSFLARIGVNVDLAPVLDVPGRTDAFIAERAFGSDPGRVSELGIAFAQGLGQGGVAAAVKHFPGLGLAVANTDLGPSTVAESQRALAPGLRPFEAAVEAGVPLVMTSNATYPAYDGRRPASLSPAVGRVLRKRLGFGGTVITDDLLAGAVTASGYGTGAAAVAATRAGADLLLFARAPAPEALPALVAALHRGELNRQALRTACARTVELRRGLGA
jgi:beta-N-acetylhexosaminidase